MPAQSVRFDRAAGFYDATRGFPPGVEVQAAELLFELGDLQPDSRVLEVGIGTGRIALPLARLGPIVHGVDLSRPMLDRLRARQSSEPVHAVLADATRLPYADASSTSSRRRAGRPGESDTGSLIPSRRRRAGPSSCWRRARLLPPGG